MAGYSHQAIDAGISLCRDKLQAKPYTNLKRSGRVTERGIQQIRATNLRSRSTVLQGRERILSIDGRRSMVSTECGGLTGISVEKTPQVEIATDRDVITNVSITRDFKQRVIGIN